MSARARALPPSCTVEALAVLLDMTPRRIQILVKDGVIPKAAHGRYPLPESVAAFVRHQRRIVDGTAAAEGVREERERLARVRRVRAELEIERLRGKSVSRDKAEHAAETWARENLQALLAIPANEAEPLAEAMTKECDARTARRELERIIRAHADRLSARAFELAGDRPAAETA